jgi:hypothetical protein
MLRTLEDAVLIYRVSRAPERRIFYIGVGNLPKTKADQYVQEMMTKHKNKLVYDAQTGEIRDDRKFLTLLEDYWLPRRDGDKTTEISTLPAGNSLGELTDVNYFLKKLMKSLNVPYSRLEPDKGVSLGRVTEIGRDEIKFSKFIDRIRRRFSMLFMKAMEKQCVLKGVCTKDEWNEIKQYLVLDYQEDNHFAEIKDSQILSGRLEAAAAIMPYIGKYYSNDFVRKHVLKQTDEEIAEIDAQIAQEKSDPQYQNMNPMMGGEFGGMPGMPMNDNPSLFNQNGGDQNIPPDFRDQNNNNQLMLQKFNQDADKDDE